MKNLTARPKGSEAVEKVYPWFCSLADKVYMVFPGKQVIYPYSQIFVGRNLLDCFIVD